MLLQYFDYDKQAGLHGSAHQIHLIGWELRERGLVSMFLPQIDKLCRQPLASSVLKDPLFSPFLQCTSFLGFRPLSSLLSLRRRFLFLLQFDVAVNNLGRVNRRSFTCAIGRTPSSTILIVSVYETLAWYPKALGKDVFLSARPWKSLKVSCAMSYLL